MEPTHALYVVDNWDGEGERYWVFAYKKESLFHSCETDKLILEHIGDEVIKEVKLP